MTIECCCDTTKVAIQATNRGEFLKKSHFRIGQLAAHNDPCRESVTKRDYTAKQIQVKALRSEPPQPAQLHHQDVRFFNNKPSEYIKSYPEKFQPRSLFNDSYKLRATNFKMDRDLAKFNEYETTHATHYPAYTLGPIDKGPENPWKSYIPQGDPEKAPSLISDYRDRFLGHDPRTTKPKRAVNKHLAESTPTILGDGRLDHFETSFCDQFKGAMLPRVEPFPKPVGTNIPVGDNDKVMLKETVHRSSYVHQPLSHAPYNKKEVVGTLGKTNFRLDDGIGTCDTYKSTAAESFKPRSGEGLFQVLKERNHSDLPNGDSNATRSAERFTMTTNKFHFDNPITLPVKIVSGANRRTKSKVWFGDPVQGDQFYSTTTASTFAPNGAKLQRYQRPYTTSRSDIPVKYYDGLSTVPTMRADFKNPCQDKLVPNETALSRIRDSHIKPPTRKNCFSTEHKDQFFPKETELVPIDCGKLQRSTLPLGTMRLD